MLTDYHIHSKFSPDSRAEMSDIAATAVLNGVSEIAITDHYDIVPKGAEDWTAGYDPDGYFAELENVRKMYAGDLTIRAGIEMGNAYVDTKKADGFINNYPYDFVLASIHFSNGDWLDYSFNEKVYLQEMEQIVEWGNFDCLAHFDLPCRYGWHFEDDDETTERILKKLLSHGNKGLELNISGMAKGTEPEIMPNRKILEMWENVGGRIVTTGTDSHVAGTVGKYIGEGQEILLRCGFSEIAIFEGRNVCFKQIEFRTAD